MNFFSNLFSFNGALGLIGMVGGFFMIKEAYYLNHHIMFLGYFEKKFGPGNGTTAYKLIGLILIVFSLFVFIGAINLFDNSTLQGTELNQTPTEISPFPNNNTGGPRIAP
ncbi:hypothetical protein HC766_01525 [Candidatus Gracilibacteria bacterium]|nr:hypothetical protein [Candidatus Gracilibacteria bacterium]NJS41053.1 hypothetical protein [Candidatus Gracilibacteria bacterium]